MKNVLFFTATGIESANPLLWERRWDECSSAKIKDTLIRKECCNQLKLCSGHKARTALSCRCTRAINLLFLSRWSSDVTRLYPDLRVCVFSWRDTPIQHILCQLYGSKYKYTNTNENMAHIVLHKQFSDSLMLQLILLLSICALNLESSSFVGFFH